MFHDSLCPIEHYCLCLDFRALFGFPDRNIQNQRGDIFSKESNFSPTFCVPVRITKESGILPRPLCIIVFHCSLCPLRTFGLDETPSELVVTKGTRKGSPYTDHLDCFIVFHVSLCPL